MASPQTSPHMSPPVPPDIVFLVQVHANPAQFARTAASLLLVPGSALVVHVDARVDQTPFLAATEAMSGVVFVRDRVHVHWGSFSQVEATLASVTCALSAFGEAERFCLVSGDTYPARRPAEIAEFFTAHPERNYINCVRVPNSELNKSLSRISHVNLEHDGRTGRFLRLHGLINRYLARPWRGAFAGRVPYAGSTWWALNRQALTVILHTVDNERRFMRFYRNTCLPDEHFFQTVLANSSFEPSLAPALMYTAWNEGSPSPRTLDAAEVERLKAVGRAVDDAYGHHELLFARKFDDPPGELLALVESELW
ncbi:beta-1,6-N-acetylglucosaminyltransferase [Jatrophihabitans telluris]|uniref:Peptide O-xylosyltransferase n=1 Tax=Jatrophihabitans telluris TaxID=2038343 RepID=A0ABY4QWJ1_9ACTN|nr:beta-1,6-N-acetylglucosaminyltransferase [Jatrophihabitans telluris]UQX87880.1 beta-1,6-N-acetylglucosaminyltransferase [Jatrophihabitans telluris]